MTRLQCACAAAVFAVSAQAALVADVLTLRDGRRVEGMLVAVRGNAIEFEVASGRDAGRVVRFDRTEVRSIQFEDRSLAFDRPDSGRRDDFRPPTAFRERTVTVDADTAWTDSGVTVRAGQDLAFAATGQVRWGPGRRHGAAGERNSPFNGSRPMPDRNAAALIGKIGEDGDPFFIGDNPQPLRMRGNGRLYLGINDDYLQDNSGSLRVVIAY